MRSTCSASDLVASQIDSQLGKLREDVYKKLSPDLRSRIYEAYKNQCQLKYPVNTQRRFLLVCQPFLETNVARAVFENFKAVVFEMTRLLGIQQGGYFWALRVLEISEAMSEVGLADLNHWVEVPEFNESLQETGEDENTCRDYRVLFDDECSR